MGHGWVVNSKNIDAYKGVEVKDKIMIVSGLRRPKGIAAQEVKGSPGGETWESPLSFAKSHGAKAIISVPTFQELLSWDRTRQSFGETGVLSVNELHEPSAQQRTGDYDFGVDAQRSV
ncbi:MAG: hypothetical protein WKF84_10815 [Pyrinomonadaceae bacterium]